MKAPLAIWSTYFHELSPEDAVREFNKHGIYAAELSTEHSKVLLARGDAAEVGKEFARLTKDFGITRVVTIESSGIALYRIRGIAAGFGCFSLCRI